MTARQKIDHERVLTLWENGLTSQQIADQMGLKYAATARTVVRRARPPTIRLHLVIALSPELAVSLDRRAAAMNLTRSGVVTRLLKIVFAEGLESAVFDDAEVA